MPSLSRILRDHSPLLLIDAASARIQVGLLDAGAPARWSSRSDEAGVGLFECLDELDLEIGAMRAFAFCEGPGSILGIRTSAMALRAWNVLRPRPTFAYIGLAVVAESLGRPGLAIIADARRGQWHRLFQGGELARVPAAELSGELAMPEGLRHWDPLPAGTALTSYDLASLFASTAVADADLFRETAAPDAFLHREPEYLKWVPQIHRAP
jgi:tRNA threonylcarbamoyladenosine biosynthesis protein TsaB